MATRDTRRIVEVPSDRFEAPIRNDRLASAVVDQKDLKIESSFFVNTMAGTTILS
jgi:hypothetical protein